MAHLGQLHKSSDVLKNKCEGVFFRFSPGQELGTDPRQRRWSLRWWQWSGKGRPGDWKKLS